MFMDIGVFGVFGGIWGSQGSWAIQERPGSHLSLIKDHVIPLFNPANFFLSCVNHDSTGLAARQAPFHGGSQIELTSNLQASSDNLHHDRQQAKRQFSIGAPLAQRLRSLGSQCSNSREQLRLPCLDSSSLCRIIPHTQTMGHMSGTCGIQKTPSFLFNDGPSLNRRAYYTHTGASRARKMS